MKVCRCFFRILFFCMPEGRNPFRARPKANDAIDAAFGEAQDRIPTAEPNAGVPNKTAKRIAKDAGEKSGTNNLSILQHKHETMQKKNPGRVSSFSLPAPAPSYVLRHPMACCDTEQSICCTVSTEGANKGPEQSTYYHTPETHRIQKEKSRAFDTIFFNWRLGIADIFRQFRHSCANNLPFSFVVQVGECTGFFHTNAYNGCENPCCVPGKKHALSFQGVPEHSPLRKEIDAYTEHNGIIYFSGTPVLFVLDTILNAPISAVQPIPFVISTHVFSNSIVSRPSAAAPGARTPVSRYCIRWDAKVPPTRNGKGK